MILHLRSETEARLSALAAASGVSVDDYLSALVEKQSSGDVAVTCPQEQPSTRPTRHIWEVIAENMKNVPREDFDALPRDGLSQIDHYVYGVPKRTL
jgi:hypothetical protein